MNLSGEENLIETTLPPDLSEAVNQHSLIFSHIIRSLRGKLDELNILISQCSNLHILAFTETWLNDNITDGEISLFGYSIYRRDRTNGIGGGIAFISRTLFPSSGERIWKGILLGNVYDWRYFYPRQKEFYLVPSIDFLHSLTF